MNKRTYIVKSGDTLVDIAKKVYGSVSKVDLIILENKNILKLGVLYPGTELVIPEEKPPMAVDEARLVLINLAFNEKTTAEEAEALFIAAKQIEAMDKLKEVLKRY